MMKRLVPAVLAALIIPACGHDHDDDVDDNQLTIANNGDEIATVHLEHEQDAWFGGGQVHHEAFDLGAGDQQTRFYSWTHVVRVYIERRRDGLMLFHDSYDPDDCDRHDQRIRISVAP